MNIPKHFREISNLERSLKLFKSIWDIQYLLSISIGNYEANLPIQKSLDEIINDINELKFSNAYA